MSDEENVGEQIVSMLENDRAWRRHHPQEFFAEIADDLWRTLPDNEAIDDFVLRLQGVPWWASDVVGCLEMVVRTKPEWAVTTLVSASQRGAWLDVDPEEHPEVYLRWLAEQLIPMQKALELAKQRPPA